jgi:hypothetical protein
MPIVESTPKKCFERFRKHLAKLVAATVTAERPLLVHEGDTRITLSFREGKPVAVPIDTDYGRLFFYLGQALEAVPEDGMFRLVTRQYWYRIQTAAPLTAKAALRWEYDSATPPDAYPRHHAQMKAALALGGGHQVDLDKVHMPTGWVTVEEVIRFLICELGMRPPCGAKWPDLLADSERAFYEDFTSKRYRAG